MSVQLAFREWCKRHNLKPVRTFSTFGSAAIGESRLIRRKGKVLVETCIHSSNGYSDEGGGFGFNYPFRTIPQQPSDLVSDMESDR